MHNLITPVYQGWLNSCENRELVIEFMDSIQDEDGLDVLLQAHRFVMELPRLDSWDELLEGNSYESIKEYLSWAGPFEVKMAYDLFSILRRSLEEKLHNELRLDIINVMNMCFLRLLDRHYEELTKEFPQLKDEDFIERLDARIACYELTYVTLDNLKRVIKELTEEK